MANTIQIKRSAGSSAPGASDLSKGELAWVDHGTGGGDRVLYIGDMTAAGAVTRVIGGTADSSYISDILNGTALTGVPTAPTAAVDTSTTQLATTAFVQNQITANQNPISQAGDTDISGTQSAGHVLIWDGNNSWDDKGLSGDVTMDKDGNIEGVDTEWMFLDSIGQEPKTGMVDVTDLKATQNQLDGKKVSLFFLFINS